jgi:hypothetical protein
MKWAAAGYLGPNTQTQQQRYPKIRFSKGQNRLCIRANGLSPSQIMAVGSWQWTLLPLIKYLRTKKWQEVYCLSTAAPLLRLLQWLLRLATAATTDTASNRHPSHRQDQPPAKKNCVANWLQWLLLPVLLLATAPYCSLLLLDGSCFDSDSSPVSLTRSPPPPTASYFAYYRIFYSYSCFK